MTDIAKNSTADVQQIPDQVAERLQRGRLAIDSMARRIAARLPATAAALPLHELIVLVLQIKQAIDDEDRAAFTVPF
jgi:hypothetical protein